LNPALLVKGSEEALLLSPDQVLLLLGNTKQVHCVAVEERADLGIVEVFDESHSLAEVAEVKVDVVSSHSAEQFVCLKLAFEHLRDVVDVAASSRPFLLDNLEALFLVPVDFHFFHWV
jgi:hypothetical protein